MQINSFAFFAFLMICAFAYHKLNQKASLYILALCNIIFYAYGGIYYLPIIFYITIVSYFAALYLSKDKKNKTVFSITFIIIALLVLLLFFKYYNFLIVCVTKILKIFNIITPIQTHSLVWPLGISFFTFTALGYVLDVAMNKIEANKNFLKHFIFVSFFPTVSSGPILRYNDFMPQLSNKKSFDYENFSIGLTKILWGLVKKLVIADNIGKIVNSVYSDIPNSNGPIIILAIMLYAFQIYCDFSGYSDVAIGTANILGFNVAKNFNRPYFATTFSEFWSRWHISLTTWFKDYIFTPLSFTFPKTGLWGILLIYIISGIWHGAGLNYILWGGLNGLFLIVARVTIKKRRKLHKINPLYKNKVIKHIIQSSIIYTLFAFSLVFFRLLFAKQAIAVLLGIFKDWSILFDVSATIAMFKSVGIGTVTGVMLIFYICLVFIVELIEEKHNEHIAVLIRKLPKTSRIATYYALIWLYILFANMAQSSYIYYQF